MPDRISPIKIKVISARPSPLETKFSGNMCVISRDVTSANAIRTWYGIEGLPKKGANTTIPDILKRIMTKWRISFGERVTAGMIQNA